MRVILKKILVLSIGSFLATSSCKKSGIDKDPESRNFRKDIFNCLINETRWDPAKSDSGYVRAYIINSSADEYFITLDAGGPQNNTIVVHVAGVKFAKGPVTYPINQNVPQNVLDFFVHTMYPVNFGLFNDGWINSNNNSPMHKLYFTSAEHTGEVTITKFTMEPAPMAGTFRGIIAGSFYFKALHSNTNESVNVRDGNFEIEYWK